MEIRVRAKVKSKREYVIKLEDGSFEVAVKEPPIENRANERIIELLAEYFDVPKSNVKIKLGKSSKFKVFMIEGI